MAVFDDCMKKKNYIIEDIMNMKIPFINTEFMTWLTRTRKTKPSLAKCHESILNTMFSLIFGTVQVSATAQRLITHAISNNYINNPRYGNTWDINQQYDYSRERPQSNLLSDEELQVKLASFLISLCFVRMEEIANIDLSVSIIDDEEQTAANWEQADQRYVSTRLEKLVKSLEVQNATANSIRHASSTDLQHRVLMGEQQTSLHIIRQIQRQTSNSTFSLQTRCRIPQHPHSYTITARSKLLRLSQNKWVMQESPKEMDYNNLLQQMICSYLHRRLLLHLFPYRSFRPSSSLKLSLLTITRVQKTRDHKCRKATKTEPYEEAQDSSMTKDSDRATTAGAQK
ncbi:MAG: hypothetical protein EZS28_002998 [Streblomastix strix]|uniref:Tyr recombinase domain-containing protein n=1 Tax=Streblomastix strix TaxID=222440 RepID=A0A5J4X2R2_9EUKA|nr:MAG: hypothetical protein EZS28_002998 [Streblomastix strix]